MMMFSKKITQKNSTSNHFASKILLLSALVVVVFGSCKKFLEMPVKDKLPQESLFSDEQGFIDALTGVYLGMGKPLTNSDKGLYTHDLTMGMLSALANNYPNASSSSLYNSFYGNVVRFDYEQVNVKQEITSIWSSMYNNIANLNNLLTYIDAKESVFTRDYFNRVKGESIALRALFHFDLARMYGQSPATGMSEKAIPYVRSFSATPSPFVPLQSALDSCIADLEQAKDLLAKTDTSKINGGTTDLFTSFTQNRMNYWATKALLARVYLYKGDVAKAKKMAMEVIGSNKFPLSTSNVAIATAPVRDRLFSGELIFSLYSTNLKANNEGLFNVSSGTPLQLPLANKNAIYGTTAPLDWRLSWFDNNNRNTNVPSKYFQDANLPYILQDIVPLIRVSEMYYIVAECENMEGNLSAGINYLNQVRKARGLNPLAESEVQDRIGLGIEISKEYKKEFIQEGQTFFYYKRLNMDLKVESGTTMPVPPNAYVFPIPDKENEYNPK